MADIVDRIHEEHRIMSRLLARLEREVETFERGERPDFDLIREILDVMLTWPAACHHPKEALLEARLAKVSPEMKERVGIIEREHLKMGEQLANAQQALESILMEVEVSRETFVAMTRNLIARVKYHLMMEEEEFLPLARAHLDSEVLEELARQADAELAGRAACEDTRLEVLLAETGDADAG
jgi:hemerythrin-like domain-containing protein